MSLFLVTRRNFFQSADALTLEVQFRSPRMLHWSFQMPESAVEVKPYLTKQDVADLLQVSIRQIDNMVKSQQLPPAFYLSARTPRWRREDLDAYFAAKRTAAITLRSN